MREGGNPMGALLPWSHLFTCLWEGHCFEDIFTKDEWLNEERIGLVYQMVKINFSWIQNIHLSSWMAAIYTTARSRSWLMEKYFFLKKYCQVTISAVPECGVILSLCSTDSTAHGMGWSTKWSKKNFSRIQNIHLSCWMAAIYTTARSRSWLMKKKIL